MFQSTSPFDFDRFLEEVLELVTVVHNRRLTALATEEGVNMALFMMHPEKLQDLIV